jgi:phage tail protein X
LAGLLQVFYSYLSERLEQDDKVAIIIDEAQRLEVGVLQDLARLVSRPDPSSDILKILLVGQPEFEATLFGEELRQFRGVAFLHRRVRALDMNESRIYVDHRLRVVGSQVRVIFAPDAVERICTFARGIPRVINVVCDTALLRGCLKQTKRIDGKAVREVIKELWHLEAGPAGRQPKKSSRQVVTLDRKRSGYRSTVLSGAVAALSLIAALSLLAVSYLSHRIPVKGTVQVVQVQEKVAEEKSTGAKPIPAVTAARGSTLLQLSKRHYGHTSPTILDMVLEANPAITNINLIYVKQGIVMPPLSIASAVLPSRDNRYLAYLGTFTDRPPARVFENEPTLTGKTIEIVPRKVSSRETWYRVLAGPFSTREEGARTIRALREKGFLRELSLSEG